MFTVTLMLAQDKSEVIENVNDVSFVGEYMILCLVDLETRVVRPLKDIRAYTIVKFVPVTAELLGNAAPGSEVAPNSVNVSESSPDNVNVSESAPDNVNVSEPAPNSVNVSESSPDNVNESTPVINSEPAPVEEVVPETPTEPEVEPTPETPTEPVTP